MEISRTEYIKKFHSLKVEEEVKIIMGVRRCGKTCLLKSIKEELLERSIKKENIIC